MKVQMESWEGYREDNFPKFEKALWGGGASSNNLMAPANTLSLEDFIAKFNMDISKLQKDSKVAKDQLKVMEIRKNVTKEREKKYGEFFLFWNGQNVQVVAREILKWSFQEIH